MTGSNIFKTGLAAGFLFFLSSGYAQTTGALLGRISDSTGAVLPGVTVEARNLGTALTRSAVSDQTGSYLIPSLPPGEYQVTAEAAGFKGFTQTGITLQVTQNARLDINLEVGAVVEEVTVVGEALRVDTRSTTVGATIKNLQAVNLPLNGRNVLALTQLLPGVGRVDAPTVFTRSHSGPKVNVSGGRANENNIMLDGTSLMSAWNVGQNLPSPDTIQEFRVLTNTYSAEFGRASGSIITAITKSGTNDFHGSLWEYLRNDNLNARNFFAAGKPILIQNQFGGSIGGPVMLPGYRGRDKTFFFTSFEGLEIRQQSLRTDFPVTARERLGDYSHLARPLIDPLSGATFPNNQVPPSRFDPLARNFLTEYVPLPNRPDGRNVDPVAQPISGKQLTVKIDHLATASDHLSFRLFQNRALLKDSSQSSPLLTREAKYRLISATLNEVHTFTPTLLGEVSAAFTRVDNPRSPSPASKSPRELGGNYNQDGSVPQTPVVNVTGRFNLHGGDTLNEPQDSYQMDGKLSWVAARHSVKFGAKIMRLRYLQRQDWLTSGRATFDGAFTGNSVADFLTGRANSFLQNSMLEDESLAGNYHFFVQDDLRLHPRFTLNLGLRYELNTPYVQRRDYQASIRPDPYAIVAGFEQPQQSQRFPTAPPGLVFPGDPGVPRGIIPTDKNDFQPRVGFAWDVTGNGRTAVRAGFGVFNTLSGARLSTFVRLSPPFLLPISLAAPPSFSDPYKGRKDPFPYVLDPKNAPFIFPVQLFTISPDFRNGYVYHFNLNIQKQLSGELFIQAGYVGRVGHKLSSLYEANTARFTPDATPANVQSRRPFFPQYYAGIANVHSGTNSNYHSLQVKVDKRFSAGLSFEAAYTFSKAIDEVSENRESAVGGFGPQDPNNYRGGERGLASFDQRHILAINGIWDLPFWRNQGLLTHILGGWRLAGLTQLSSGFPFTVISGRDQVLGGSGQWTGQQRPDVVGNTRLDPNRPHGELVARYFDTSGFALPARGKYGNSGRNNLIGPGFAKTDLAVIKSFALPREKGQVEFRGEIFNLFNSVNFDGPNANLNSPAFGRLLSAQDARIVQLALRFRF